MPGLDEIFRVVGLLTVAGFLLVVVAGMMAGIAFGVCRLAPKVSRRVQARRFSNAAVQWAEAEFRRERFRRGHGL